MAVTFNGTSRLIEVTDPADLTLDAQQDIYSAWKDWVQQSTVNAGFAPALRTFGGDTTTSGQTAPKYYFLQNYWRVYINNGQIVSVGLNLYSDDYPSPYIVGAGSGVSGRNSDAVNVNEEDIKNQSFINARVYMNTVAGEAGIIYPIGTPPRPSNNYDDAYMIATSRKLNEYHLEGTLALLGTHDITETGWYGRSPIESLMAFSNHDMSGSSYERIGMTGSASTSPSSRCSLYQSVIGNFTNFNGIGIQCGFNGNVTLWSGCTERQVFDFSSSVLGGDVKPEVNINGANCEVQFRHYSGGLKISGSTNSNCKISVDGQGRLEIDSTNTQGEMVIGGTWDVIDNSGVNFTVIRASEAITQTLDAITWSKKASDNAEQLNTRI